MKGEDILQIAGDHLGERYVLGARAPLTNAGFRGPWDCAEFTTWCAYQAYGMVFGAYGQSPKTADAYSGKWYEDGKAAGTLISVADALGTAGAFVVRKPGDFNINIGHVAICVGDNTLLEARSKIAGVVHSKGAAKRPWTAGVHIPGILYEGGKKVPHKPTKRILSVVHPFIRTPSVKVVQCALVRRGYSLGTIDGIYGPETTAAVSNFQIEEGLVVDGEVGPETAGSLAVGWPIDESLVDTLCAGL